MPPVEGAVRKDWDDGNLGSNGFAHQLPGTMLAWCSISETITRSPSPSWVFPKLLATRFKDSVVPLAKMSSSAVTENHSATYSRAKRYWLGPRRAGRLPMHARVRTRRTWTLNL